MISTLANEKVVDVTVGSDHCLALTEDGDLYGWGKNSNGEVTTSCEPVRVPTLIENVPKNSVTYVSCGASQVSARERERGREGKREGVCGCNKPLISN